MIELFEQFVRETYISVGCAEQSAKVYALITTLLTSLAVCYLFVMILKCLITPVVKSVVKSTETLWDDYLFDDKVLIAFWRLFGAVLFYQFLPDFSQYSLGYTIVTQGLKIIITLFAVFWLGAFLDKINHYTTEQEKVQHQTLIGVVQFIKLIAYFICAIIVVAFLFGKNPLSLIAGLGAAATVLMLVFKDSILGLVAGIQLSTNQMLKPGDWVAIEKLNIDGIVQEVSLTTVKIKNFDNTISTVPPYTLVSDSFRNWDNVFMSGARQVKRSFNIDMNSVRHLTAVEMQKLHEQGMITDEELAIDLPQVNLSVFRSYCRRMIISNPDVNKMQTIVVRLLQSTPHGLPIELYFYLAHTEWVGYEERAALIQERLLAVLPEFGLKVFQHPTGYDLHLLLGDKENIKIVEP